jgi:hypothetical protein
MKRFAREKLANKNIKWVEEYTDKTQFLKEQFEDVVGPGSYFRFEGKNLDNQDEYYCIIGPANIHKPRAKFFAGVRKLPATYSAGGKYFDSMDRAAEYARETWGVTVPKSMKPYTSAALFGIEKKVDDWKEKREAEDEKAEGKGSEDKDSKKDKKDYKKEASNEGFSMKKFNLADRINKEAMGSPWNFTSEQSGGGHTPPVFWDLSLLLSYENSDDKDASAYGDYAESIERWQETLEDSPSTRSAYREARQMYYANRLKIRQSYGADYSRIDDFFKVYLGYSPDAGNYITTVAPYSSKGERHGLSHVVGEAVDTFNFFTLKVDNASPAEMAARLTKHIQRYSDQFGIMLTPADFEMDLSAASSEFDQEKEKQTRDHIVYNSLDPESESGKELYNSQPVIGTGTIIGLNGAGIEKIIGKIVGDDENWRNIYQQAVTEVSGKENVNPALIYEGMLKDTGILNKIYAKMKQKFDAIDPDEAAAMGMTAPPKWELKRSKVGGQSSSTPKAPMPLIRDLEFQKHVLQILADGVEEGAEVAAGTPLDEAVQARLNKSRTRKRKKFEVPIEQVRRHLELIKDKESTPDANGNPVQRSYTNLMAEITSEQDALQAQRGYQTLGEALNMAQLHFSGLPIDPDSRMIIGAPEYLMGGIGFNPAEDYRDSSMEELYAFRYSREQEEAAAVELQEASEQELELEIGENVEQEAPLRTPQRIPEVPTQGPPSSSSNSPFAVEDDDEEISQPESNEMSEEEFLRLMEKDVIGNTIDGLIKVASDLDKDGKHDAAEEVHNVIRKYQGRIK